MGLALAMSRRWDEAAREFEAAALAGPGDAEVFLQLGKARHAMGQNAKAEAALRRCCDLDPQRSEAGALLGIVLMQEGRQAGEKGHQKARGHEAARVPPQEPSRGVQPLGEEHEGEGGRGHEAAHEASPGRIVPACEEEHREQQHEPKEHV